MNVLEHLRKESLDIYNRLHSIAEDATFVEQVHRVYPGVPLLPNLRCGAWYSDPSIANGTPAYFKSTDGHFSNWSFNLRRANLHLLPVVAEHNGMILVDSTRAGKRIPDALSKTVPIWCTVINRAITRRYPRPTGHEWDIALYTPPGAVSVQEHHQIEQRIDAWADALINSSFDLPDLPHPLRPLWITPATTAFPSIIGTHNFLPVICLSASKQIQFGTERRSVGFSYIQGSGDDHELWSMGLTPRLFWKHKNALLTASRASLPDLIRVLVDQDQTIGLGKARPNPVSKIGGRLLICALQDLTGSNLEDPNGQIAYVLLGSSASVTTTSNNTSQQAPEASPNSSVLHLSLASGKKGQAQFLHCLLPLSMSFIHAQLARDKHVCIASEMGLEDAGIGIILAALQMFFDDEGTLIIDDADGEESRAKGKVQSSDKRSIRTRLQWIIASRPETNPSRAILKRVNEFLLSPPTNTPSK